MPRPLSLYNRHAIPRISYGYLSLRPFPFHWLAVKVHRVTAGKETPRGRQAGCYLNKDMTLARPFLFYGGQVLPAVTNDFLFHVPFGRWKGND